MGKNDKTAQVGKNEYLEKLAALELELNGMARWLQHTGQRLVVVKSGESLTEDQVLAHCSASMASFKAPKRVVFADALPKNPSGKLLKRQLRQSHASLFDSA